MSNLRVLDELAQLRLLCFEHRSEGGSVRATPFHSFKYEGKSPRVPVAVRLMKEQVYQWLIEAQFSISVRQRLNQPRERDKCVWSELVRIAGHNTALIKLQCSITAQLAHNLRRGRPRIVIKRIAAAIQMLV